MSPSRSSLRLDAATLEPSDDLVHRLATAARSSSAPTPARRHRVALAIAAFVGISGVSVGGAWAVGAIEVPGLPSSPLGRSEVTPSPEPPTEGQQDDGAGRGGEPGADGSGSVPHAPAPTPDVEESGDQPAEPPAGDEASDDGANEVVPPGQAKEKDKPEKKAKEKDQDPGQGNGQGQTRREDKGDNGRNQGQEKQKQKQEKDDAGRGKKSDESAGESDD